MNAHVKNVETLKYVGGMWFHFRQPSQVQCIFPYLLSYLQLSLVDSAVFWVCSF